MHFFNFLQRYFDIEIEHTFDPAIQGSNETGKDVTKIWVYEKNEDCEPLLTLTESWWYTETKTPGNWLIGNTYSVLEHGREIHESDFRKLVKAGKVISQYKQGE
ncbi:cobalamin biosynthesis protein CbiX [Salmonella enterica]|nr:cobalamin biosynthesis protein CbiX [Salmonella enterica]